MTFHKKGYVVIKNAISADLLGACREELNTLVGMARDGRIQSARVMNTQPFFENIGKINWPFEQFAFCSVLQAIEGLQLDKIFSNYLELDYDDFCCGMLRLHVTSSSYKYQQGWHRDNVGVHHVSKPDIWANPRELRMNVYFFDETGFQVIPRTNTDVYDRFSDNPEINKVLEQESLSNLTIGETISVNAGDIVIFHPELIHRGYCSQERASFHVMFDKATDRAPVAVGNFPKNIRYCPEYGDDLEARYVPTRFNLRSFMHLLAYYSPLPSISLFRDLIEGNSLKRLTYYQRPSKFQD